MSLSMYQASAPRFINMLNNLSAILDKAVPAAKLDGAEARDVTIKLRGQDTTFKGTDYLLAFAWPNFYFHVTTVYNILRHNGVEIGKRDFLGTP